MKHEKLIEKHLGINTPYWIKEKINNAINEALHQFGVSSQVCPKCKSDAIVKYSDYKECRICDNVW